MTIDQIRDVHEIQGRDGTWNHSPYMRGLFNGLELAVALAEGRAPRYREEPDVYLCDVPVPEGLPEPVPEGAVTP